MLFNERLISQRKSPREATKQNILNAKNQAMSISIFNSSNEFRNKPTIIIATRKMLEVAQRMALCRFLARFSSILIWSMINFRSSGLAEARLGVINLILSMGRPRRLVIDSRRSPMPEISTTGTVDVWSIRMRVWVYMP